MIFPEPGVNPTAFVLVNRRPPHTPKTPVRPRPVHECGLFLFKNEFVASITSTTDPVLGSILLTGEAGPSEPNKYRSRLR